MKVIPPVTITPSMVIINVFETLPPSSVAWSSATTFAVGDYVYVLHNNTTYDIFQSKVAGNLNHTPPSANVSDAFWLAYGTVYKQWVAGTYALNDIVTDSHKNYQSLAASNSALLTDTTKWQYIGPTNATAAFDQLRNTQTISTNDLVMYITLGQRADAIALIGLLGSSVEVDVISNGVSVYHVSIPLNLRKTKSWKEYYFGTQKQQKVVELFDLPPYSGGVIKVVVKRGSGNRGLGGVILGKAVYLGETQYSPTSDHDNYSTITRDFAGGVTLIPRRSVPKVNEKIQFPKELTDSIIDVRELTNGVPAFWSGLEDFTDPYFGAVQVYGPAKQFALDLTNFSFGVITLEVEEM